jgi:hypothetical protein
LYESDLTNTSRGASLKQLVATLPIEFIPLDQAVEILRSHGYVSDNHDGQQACERMVQWGVAAWGQGPPSPENPSGLQIRRQEFAVRSEDERRKLAQRVWLIGPDGERFAFNHDADDPMFKPRNYGKTKARWRNTEEGRAKLKERRRLTVKERVLGRT